MKFNVPGKEFAAQLQAVSKVINAKNSLQILENFLLRVDGDTLYITGSDQESFLTASLTVFDSDGEGEIAINAKRILDITKEVSAQPIQFEAHLDTLSVTLSFSTGKFNFPGVNAAEFPRKKVSDDEKIAFSLPSDVVRKGIENTIFAVSLESIRPIMTGIYWDIKSEAAVFVSSDTHKLVKYENSETAPGVECSFILPSKVAGIIRSLIKADDADVNITKEEKSAEFNFGSYSLSCRLIKGVYPNYNRVIPESNPFSVIVDRNELLTATRRVSIFASQASNLLRLSLSDNVIELTAQDLDFSTDAAESVACEYDGNPMMIGFKADYMKEVLSNLKGDMVKIELSDPARPGLFLPAKQEEGEYIVMLQMPMQVFE
ncbi:MAG: DNA polymerase III subunit beta [Clostridium sp.]|nr:DNA polymerase III subunit beta [Prevotella sp.]MCM1428226.1 DNA polymerase III subunit beta [Clostridium sp.]MCM1475956.1 DNA polymerase III subunit beta [Muribaculaceae bacterium]